MGIGSSRGRYEFRSRGQYPASQRRKRRRRSRPGKVRPASPIQSVIPGAYDFPWYLYGSQPAYEPMSPGCPASMPVSYNNYAASPYASPYSPMMMPFQQAPYSGPIMMPQAVPQFQPMMMPQQVAPPIFSPYISPFSMGMPLSTPYGQQVLPNYNNMGVSAPFSAPYAQQQSQAPPIYNDIGGSAPIYTGMAGSYPPPPSYQAAPRNLFTDWTGGGTISPGFLGPPI